MGCRCIESRIAELVLSWSPIIMGFSAADCMQVGMASAILYVSMFWSWSMT